MSDTNTRGIPRNVRNAVIAAPTATPAAPSPTIHDFALGARSGISTMSQRSAFAGTPGGSGAPGADSTSFTPSITRGRLLILRPAAVRDRRGGEIVGR